MQNLVMRFWCAFWETVVRPTNFKFGAQAEAVGPRCGELSENRRGALGLGTQRAQYPSMKEHTLGHDMKAPII